MKNKISIITVCFNAADTIEETINSVVNQPYDNKEYIIIDGGSTDGTLDIIKKYEDRIAYWASEPDYGLYHAMNKGIEKATGDIIGMINADDYYFDDIFVDVVKAFDGKSLEEHIFFGDMFHDGDIVKGWRQENVKIGAFGAHPSMFCPKKVYDKIGKYRLWYKILADYDFMYRAYHVYNIKPIYLPKKTAFFRVGGLASNNIFRSFTEEMLIKIENGEKIAKAFPIYLLKLLKFYIKSLWK
ncbi:glycosyl transferase, family 2 [Sulfurimonas gotlandica GD1]|uniref:Glycosyl transferase, family 2 n=1 Tax=Sulfurimonas gotlandica (strain DSM 19862 / JCM 16533 / GD1) TaxID=929558 RepID=B6BKG3_SULGG|nr:glycosyltransferase family 2 protein [Sulfurimonas gotlandica]EDZ62421.1 glycosyl transferase, family 2 [Sulfurimonas gotlandica GD1]EHP29018.1 glycosyl transferase, family 2 [Sulfurimonas gotlandica GD1]